MVLNHFIRERTAARHLSRTPTTTAALGEQSQGNLSNSSSARVTSSYTSGFPSFATTVSDHSIDSIDPTTHAKRLCRAALHFEKSESVTFDNHFDVSSAVRDSLSNCNWLSHGNMTVDAATHLVHDTTNSILARGIVSIAGSKAPAFNQNIMQHGYYSSAVSRSTGGTSLRPRVVSPSKSSAQKRSLELVDLTTPSPKRRYVSPEEHRSVAHTRPFDNAKSTTLSYGLGGPKRPPFNQDMDNDNYDEGEDENGDIDDHVGPTDTQGHHYPTKGHASPETMERIFKWTRSNAAAFPPMLGSVFFAKPGGGRETVQQNWLRKADEGLLEDGKWWHYSNCFRIDLDRMEISPQGLLHFLKDGGLPEEYYPPLQVYLQGMLTSHNPPGKNYISVANAEKFARRCGFLDKLMPTINQARADEPKQLQLQCSLCGVEFLTICKGRGALVHIESHAHELGLPKLSKGKLRRCHFLGCNAVMDQRWPNYKSHFSVCPFAP